MKMKAYSQERGCLVVLDAPKENRVYHLLPDTVEDQASYKQVLLGSASDDDDELAILALGDRHP